MTYTDRHRVEVDVPVDVAWRTVVHLGGDARLWTPGLLWRVRGGLEELVGGPGHRITGPGRALRVGDAMDFWRVEAVRPPHRLRLRAESLLPGTAHLEVVLTPLGTGTELALVTEFDPRGPVGHAFWWSERVAHEIVFALLVRRLASLVTGAALE